MDYHELHKLTVAKLREMAAEYEDLVGVTAMSKDKLVTILAGKLGIELPHKVVTGIDKTSIKAQIREAKKLRDAAIAAKDKPALAQAHTRLHRLRHALRRATKITVG